MLSFHVTAKQVGYLATWYFIAYAAMQIPAGALLDHFGPKILLSLAALCCSVGTLLFALTHSFAILELSRFITGLGSSFAMLGTLVIAATLFPPHRFALFSGMLLTIGMLGAIFGEKPLALLLAAYGMRDTLLIFFVIGLGLSVLLFFSIYRKEKKLTTITKPFAGIKQIFTSKQSWAVAIYGSLIYGTTATLGAIWGVSFLRITYGFSNPQAAGYISMIFVGWAVGSPVFGLISDSLRKRKPTLYLSALLSFIVLSIILYYPHLHHGLLAILFIAFGVTSSAFLPAFSIARELHPAEYSGTALGLMNMLNSLGGALIPPIVGIILEKNNPYAQDILHYTAKNFKDALIILPIVLLVALLLVPYIKETHCKVAKH
tara:strand:- start:79 stop:1203 length:1125 start_codon:yes stop_codon:yes gene_type:complete